MKELKGASEQDIGPKITEKFPLALMGVLAPGSAHARPSARPPIDTRGSFPVHVSAESLF